MILASLAGFAVFLLTGLVWIGRVPGIHYDEAWAAEFAHRIAAEPGFWPLDAMSPYTHPWAHYLVAVFFRIFGTDLFVYRAAGVAMCAAGAAMAWLALWREGERKAAAIFPLILALLLPFVVNERFGVEITSFQVLCLGSLLLGVQTSSLSLIFLSVFFGVTSHILFAAPALAMLVVWGMQSVRWRPRPRALVACLALSLWPFLWKIHREIPEKDKSALLLLADAAVLAAVLFLDQIPRFVRKMRGKIRWVVFILSLPLFGYVLFFSEGHWAILFFSGKVFLPSLMILSVPLTLAAAVRLVRLYLKQNWTSGERRFWSWMLFSLFLLGVLAVKPAPRYFQIAFFMEALAVAVLLARGRRTLYFILPYVVLSVSILSFSYLLPGFNSQTLGRSYRFLIFHDNSFDTRPKQELARLLGEKGCDYSRVRTDDPRLDMALRFLAHGDWPIAAGVQCPAARVRVALGEDGEFKLGWEN